MEDDRELFWYVCFVFIKIINIKIKYEQILAILKSESCIFLLKP